MDGPMLSLFGRADKLNQRSIWLLERQSITSENSRQVRSSSVILGTFLVDALRVDWLIYFFNYSWACTISVGIPLISSTRYEKDNYNRLTNGLPFV